MICSVSIFLFNVKLLAAFYAQSTVRDIGSTAMNNPQAPCPLEHTSVGNNEQNRHGACAHITTHVSKLPIAKSCKGSHGVPRRRTMEI